MSAQDEVAAGGWKPKHNPWSVAFIVTMAAFMEILDTTIVNVSLPHIAGSLSSTYDDATWTLTAYLVANGIVLTISGWLGKVFGRKQYFLVCIVMFTVSSFLCGMATSLAELIVFRMMQGFFGGGLQPNQQSIILDSFPPEKRAAAFGLTAIAAVVGPVIGPTLGGWITDNFSWRWIFFINVPFGFLTTLGVAALVEDPPWARKRKAPIDVIGISLITIGFSCLEVMVDRGEDADWFGSTFIRIMGVLAVLGLGGAVMWLLHTDKPAVDLRVFKDRNFAVGTAMMGAMGALLYASAIIVPQFAQQVMGYTATLSGLILSPGGIAVIVLIPFVGKLMSIISVRSVIALGFGLMGLALFFSAQLTPLLDFKHLVLFRMSQTACLAFLFVPLSTIAYSTIPERLNADASALFSMSRNVLGSLAISGATAMLMERKQAHQAHMVHWMTPYNQPYNEYLTQAQNAGINRGMTPEAAQSAAQHVQFLEFSRQVAMLTYNEVFMILGIGAFLCVPFCFLLSNIKSGGKATGAH
ncbi:DHA2 family efflux MFS transporter permease subunit [Acetobacter orleanensis]|uniref:MFS transporter n=1 Tax=Acetobacter orleanensis TaxID=104099 RepID=A0A4Y3TJF8_9PROT|nr:DHA2 family efflux MFS transporter permease subunit [Acetobacter orleanensis]KXV62143.1 disulfide bond formation protein DsbA [Acetobacter orleanensis]PCD80486.1 MFS transporter [Acetobacter orleanensis]GAN67433.1 multidrug resistance efflux pump EmrB/QacA [Acetobacter orleanensis JCM 7639]GBR26681.1 multidrug ABC transporter [Acetobacter orleanensis NRIC 0473]GEB81854.1 MFS transporter [Acetobacter orleanensis]